MEAISALIAVVGTLAGSALTYVFQRRITERSDERAKADRQRQERLNACAAYAGALHHYRRMLVHRWFALNTRVTAGEAEAEVTREVFELRAEAVEALYRLQLLTRDPQLNDIAVNALASVGGIYEIADDKDVLRLARAESSAAIARFVDTAAGQLT